MMTKKLLNLAIPSLVSLVGLSGGNFRKVKR